MWVRLLLNNKNYDVFDAMLFVCDLHGTITIYVVHTKVMCSLSGWTTSENELFFNSGNAHARTVNFVTTILTVYHNHFSRKTTYRGNPQLYLFIVSTYSSRRRLWQYLNWIFTIYKLNMLLRISRRFHYKPHIPCELNGY